ncbi:glycosyltransferase [Pedobacter sp. GR22-10]|uniref:glycosyltransferase n=1 Tax=Pedobacter sp. GR22-10 TaxID=2994472 RepID=UPI002247C908|nr:glycosyltransferase [Pedobacter sp. GR22-10]MCX2431363.1 glycosyltransferase [Pedobacter sp. GR22-10]
MQRIRMSLPYFSSHGWEPAVVMVEPEYTDLPTDALLNENIPASVTIHQVKALPKKWTSKVGLGSIALRALWFYKRKVNQLLKSEKFDLIYFSTTQFPVLILGPYWKKKFGVPYIIDMQDPWHSEYYQDKPKSERPKKHWFSYRLNKFLEPITMQKVDGLISVSKGYLDTLTERYPQLNDLPKRIITFAAFPPDFETVRKHRAEFNLPYLKTASNYNFVYVGRGGHDLKQAAEILFSAFQTGLKAHPGLFKHARFHFIGTSYAPKGEGVATIQPIARQMDISTYVNEQTDRLPFYQSLFTLDNADHLLILGSEDKSYTASKIFPYILSDKPILAFFHSESSAAQIISECQAGTVIPLEEDAVHLQKIVYEYLHRALLGRQQPAKTDWKAFENYEAFNMCRKQCEVFNEVIANAERKNG